MARLYGKKYVHSVVAHLPGVHDEIGDRTKQVERRAEANLAAARASTSHDKISGPEHVTRISSRMEAVDGFVEMKGTDPMAIEFGHFPSGYFAPEKYGKVTKAPQGLYILSRAAGIGGATGISSGRKRGKR